MSNLKFISTGSTTVTLSGNGLPNSFTANGSAYTLGTAISLADGEYVEFAGSTSNFSKDSTHKYQFVIGGTGTVVIEGDLISLINNNAYVKQYQFFNLFKGCNKITSIANLNFPATIADWCYANMFMDCTGLVNAGTTLPATVTSRWCYQGMFARCTALITPPTILATKLSPFCYMGMFTGCTSLVTAPSLVNRTVEGDFSTNIMFKDCSNLSTIQVSFTDWPSGGTWSRKWLDGVSNTGVFVHPNTLPISAIEATSAVPVGWTLSATYPAIIIVANQTYSFDAMSDTNQIKVFGFSYDGEETLNIAVDTTNKPAWLSYTTDGDSVDFTANGYSIDSSTTVQIPVTFSAADAQTKNVVATFSINNYPTATITVNTIPTFTFDAQSETDIVSSLMTYATGSNSISCQIVGELPTGLSAINGVITGTPSEFINNYDDTINIVYSASDARSVASSVNVQIVNATPNYSAMPLTIECIENGYFSFNRVNTNDYIGNNVFYYKKNNGAWTQFNSFGTSIYAASGDTFAFSGTSNTFSYNLDTSYRFNFRSSSGKYNVYGNLLSLCNNSETASNWKFAGLFGWDNSSYRLNVIDASNLILPSSDPGNNAYYRIFRSCSNLTGAPIWRTQTINSTNPYNEFFWETSIRKLKINATGINGNCAYNSTVNCSYLSAVEVAITNWIGYFAINFFTYTSSTGIFIKPQSLPIQRSNQYIKEGWLVLNRIGGKLYYAEATDGHQSGDLYTGEDPFAQ